MWKAHDECLVTKIIISIIKTYDVFICSCVTLEKSSSSNKLNYSSFTKIFANASLNFPWDNSRNPVSLTLQVSKVESTAAKVNG